MSTDKGRIEGVRVRVIHFDEAVLLEKLNAAILENNPAGYEAGARYVKCVPEALAYGTDGVKHYTIGHEGVGWEFDPGSLQVEFRSVGWDEGDGHVRASMGTGLMVEFSPEEAHALIARCSETVDLSDWVRSFGARLESNFWLWYGRLGGQR